MIAVVADDVAVVVGSLALSRSMLAVCEMLVAITASCACGVPATEARTFDFGWSAGIFWKSTGRSVLAMNV